MPNKHFRIIERIKSSNFSRSDLVDLEKKARSALDRGDMDAQAVLDAIGTSLPQDKYYIFMGFCPGADFSNRQDIRWRDEGICDFFFYDSPHQMERFRSIAPGDLIILKKIQQFGQTMKLYGHGRVKSKMDTTNGDRILQVKWSTQQTEIEVPLLACNETVNLKTTDKVDGEMPKEFWDWLQA